MNLSQAQQDLINYNNESWTQMNFACTEEEKVANPSCYKTRNAGGPQYFHYIMNNLYNEKMKYNEFMDLHKVYCAVSGSPISDPTRALTVQMEDKNENQVCGEYHMCCTPCFCDIQRFAKVDKISYPFAEGQKDVHVLTIKDPCKNELPSEVTSFICSDGCFDADGNRKEMQDDSCHTQNAELLPNDRIVIGVLQNGRKCSNDDLQKVQNDKDKYCQSRLTASSSELSQMGGMSNIWTELACNNDQCMHDEYYNN